MQFIVDVDKMGLQTRCPQWLEIEEQNSRIIENRISFRTIYYYIILGFLVRAVRSYYNTVVCARRLEEDAYKSIITRYIKRRFYKLYKYILVLCNFMSNKRYKNIRNLIGVRIEFER